MIVFIGFRKGTAMFGYVLGGGGVETDIRTNAIAGKVVLSQYLCLQAAL